MPCLNVYCSFQELFLIVTAFTSTFMLYLADCRFRPSATSGMQKLYTAARLRFPGRPVITIEPLRKHDPRLLYAGLTFCQCVSDDAAKIEPLTVHWTECIVLAIRHTALCLRLIISFPPSFIFVSLCSIFFRKLVHSLTPYHNAYRVSIPPHASPKRRPLGFLVRTKGQAIFRRPRYAFLVNRHHH